MYNKFAKIGSKFEQILNEHYQNGQSVLKLCQSDEFSPNLVTLEVERERLCEKGVERGREKESKGGCQKSIAGEIEKRRPSPFKKLRNSNLSFLSLFSEKLETEFEAAEDLNLQQNVVI